MLPLFNLRLFRNNNLTILQPFIDKMKRNELTLETILDEDEIIQDLKNNKNSQFSAFFSSENVRKLIDYATKMPKSDEKSVGYKYPFNATELLCCDNIGIMDKFMNEIKMGGDSSDEEEEKEEKEEKEEVKENNEEEGNEEKNEGNEKGENSEGNLKEDKDKNVNDGEKKEQEQDQGQKKEENKKEKEPKKVENKKEEGEPNKDENQKEVENKEVKNEEEKPKEEASSKIEPPKEEPKKDEEPKKEEEPKKVEEPKKEEVPKKEEEPKKEDKKEEEQNKEEQKQEKPGDEEEVPEDSKNPKEEEQKKEEPKSIEENKQEEKEEAPKEKLNKSENEEDSKPDEEEEENPYKEKDEEGNQNQINEEEQENEDQNKPVTIIYDNVDYFLGFLKESEETKSNYVLVGYFYKIFNHLLNSQSPKIIQYIFDYPKKNEFDVLGLLVKNMKRKSMGEIVNKLLLFQEEGIEDFLPQKFELLEKVLEELKETKEEDKYECICSTLITTFFNKNFFLEFMKEPKFLEKLYNILDLSQNDSNKLIAVLRLVINVQENILKNIDSRCTNCVAQENPMDFLNMFNTMYGLEETNQKEINPELDQIVAKDIVTLIGLIQKNGFNFINDLDDFSSKENGEFMPTYEKIQKKLGKKKLAQIELFRSVLDLIVNAYAIYDSQEIKDSISNIIKIAQEKKLFWKMHKLFFDFPFCNIYQSLYSQIMDIILNENSPEELVKNTLLEKEGEKENNLIQLYIDNMLKNMEFEFNSGRKAFHPNYSYELSILTKINESTNEFVKEFIKDNKNLSVFHDILGQDINSLFNQKLLYNNQKDNIQLGANIALENEEVPLQYFCKKNFMEVLKEDNEIYSTYLEGGDYEKLLAEKKEREKQEQEERKKLNEVGEKDMQEEEKEIGNINDFGDAKGAENNENLKEKEVEEENKELMENPFDMAEEVVEAESEETEEEKSFNDVNYWKPENKQDDDSMKDLLNDLD